MGVVRGWGMLRGARTQRCVRADRAARAFSVRAARAAPDFFP